MRTCKKFLAIFIFIVGILSAYNALAALVYTVSTSAGSGGTISPSSRSVNYGNTTTFTITPNSGNYISSVTGCGGSLAGNIYTTGAITANCTVTAKFMSGTLSAVAPSCTIASGSNSCNTNLSWSTTNPIGTSAVTANGMTSVSGNSGSYVSFSVPYSSRTFYLYNNGNLLAQTTVTSGCAANNTWNGSKCVLNTYTVSTSAGSGGTISPSSRSVSYGGNTTFTVSPNSGYHTNSVTGCSGSLSGSTYTTGTITANCTVTAAFGINTYTITASSGANGTVTPTGTTTKNYGTSQTYTIAPANSNYRINNVLIDNEVGVGAVSSYTFSNITTNHSISATFALKTYTVTATAGSGGTISPSSRTVNAGSATTFTVTPNTGYYISSVTGTQSCGNGSLSGNIYTAGTGINGISEDCTVTAKFAVNSYTVSTSAGSGGTISPSSRSVSYGGNTTFTVSSNSGYHTNSVTGCSGSLSGSTYTTGTITANCTVTATFGINTYTITASSGANGTVTPTGTTTKNYGTSQTYTIAPANSNYRINNVLIDNEVGVGAVSSYTFSNITANHSISATFALKTYTVTATAGSGGTISPSSRTVNAGSATTFTVTPNTGYYISSVTGTQSCGNGSLSGNIYTAGTGINGISEDCTVTAKFGINTYTITTSSGSNGTVTPAGTTTKNYGN